MFQRTKLKIKSVLSSLLFHSGNPWFPKNFKKIKKKH